MPMSMLMPMPIPRYRCRDFQMAEGMALAKRNTDTLKTVKKIFLDGK